MVTDSDVAVLHGYLLDLDESGHLEASSWHDMDRDGIPEALVILKADDTGRSPWILYEADIGGPREVISDSGVSVSVEEPEGNGPTRIRSDNIGWILTEEGPRPDDDLLDRNTRRITSATKDEVKFLAHMGYHGLVPGEIDIYRLNFIPGKGSDRVIVLRDPRLIGGDGSHPYMIIDDYNRILISGRSVEHPHIFTAENDPIEIVEVRNGGVAIRKLHTAKLP
jgi:hypothetical protein